MVGVLGRVTYRPLPSGFETHHGLMPTKCFNLLKMRRDITELYLLSVYLEYE